MNELLIASITSTGDKVYVFVVNHLPTELRHSEWLFENASKHRLGLASYAFPELTHVLFLPGDQPLEDKKALFIDRSEAIRCYKTIHLYNKENNRTKFPKEMNIQSIADGAVVFY